MLRNSFTAPTVVASAFLGLAVAEPAQAEDFRTVESADTFVSLITGRELRRLGIALTVTPQGEIEGDAFGYPVTGQWSWDGQYFCRDLYWGGDDLGYNCQLVEVRGDTIRFTSDQGAGQSARLSLR